jgi:hypothetical protein
MTVPVGGVLADHARGEAVQDAEPAVEALRVSGVEGEALGGLLVGDEHAAAVGEQRTRGLERIDRYAMSCSASKIVMRS